MGNIFLEYVDDPINCLCGTHIAKQSSTTFSKLESVDGDLISIYELINCELLPHKHACMVLKSATVYLFDATAITGDKCDNVYCKKCEMHLGYKIYSKTISKYVIFINKIELN